MIWKGSKVKKPQLNYALFFHKKVVDENKKSPKKKLFTEEPLHLQILTGY